MSIEAVLQLRAPSNRFGLRCSLRISSRVSGTCISLPDWTRARSRAWRTPWSTRPIRPKNTSSTKGKWVHPLFLIRKQNYFWLFWPDLKHFRNIYLHLGNFFALVVMFGSNITYKRERESSEKKLGVACWSGMFQFHCSSAGTDEPLPSNNFPRFFHALWSTRGLSSGKECN